MYGSQASTNSTPIRFFGWTTNILFYSIKSLTVTECEIEQGLENPELQKNLNQIKYKYNGKVKTRNMRSSSG